MIWIGFIQTIIIFQGNLSSWWTKVTVAGLLCLFVVLQRVIDTKGEDIKNINILKKGSQVSKIERLLD